MKISSYIFGTLVLSALYILNYYTYSSFWDFLLNFIISAIVFLIIFKLFVLMKLHQTLLFIIGLSTYRYLHIIKHWNIAASILISIIIYFSVFMFLYKNSMKTE